MEYTTLTVRPGEDLGEIIEQRKAIFGYGEDDLDEVAISLLLKEDGRPVALGRLLLDMENDRLIIDQAGTPASESGKGYDDKMAGLLIDLAKDCGGKDIWAKPHGDQQMIDLLEKHGFEALNSYWMMLEA